MSKSPLDIKACVFDAYGTLFDVHSAVGAHRERLGKQANEVSNVWRTKQLEYTWLRSLMGDYAEFWQITGDALEYALDAHGIEDKTLHEDLMQAYLELKPCKYLNLTRKFISLRPKRLKLNHIKCCFSHRMRGMRRVQRLLDLK